MTWFENLVNRIFTLRWRKYLTDKKGRVAKVVKVKGYRTAIVDFPFGERMTVTFLTRFYRG